MAATRYAVFLLKISITDGNYAIISRENNPRHKKQEILMPWIQNVSKRSSPSPSQHESLSKRVFLSYKIHKQEIPPLNF